MTFPKISLRTELVLILFVTLLAFGLRSVGHWQAPHGWREDELSNALVVSQHVLDGEFRLYYDDASGHEGLYHWLQAISMALFGPGVAGIRGISILLGTTSVLLTYLLARQFFGWPTAFVSSMMLAVSFWSLMYSRSGQRHISVTVTTLACFYLLWKAIDSNSDKRWQRFAASGVTLGIGFYTYFASRGVPLIIFAFAIFLFVFKREMWLRTWKGCALSFGIALIMAVPLGIILRSQPEAEARVAELAKPIYDARAGDFSTLGEYTVTTLSMFTHDGDDEVLYNVPNRPVFGWLGGLLFWAGVVISLVRALGKEHDPQSAFLLLWLGAGLAPGALSVPAASLGHTILAQAPAMILPVAALSYLIDKTNIIQQPIALFALVAVILVGWEAYRDIHDYWFVWPDDSFNRVIHHSDLHEAAWWLNENAETHDVGIGSFLNERWDQQAINIDLDGDDWRVRAYDPRSAYIQPEGGGIAVIPDYLDDEMFLPDADSKPLPSDTPYTLLPLEKVELADTSITSFDNGLTLVDLQLSSAQEQLVVESRWLVEHPLELSPRPLLSKPPAPDENDSQRLALFVQLLNDEGDRVAGADGLAVDPYTLYQGDIFILQTIIDLSGLSDGEYTLVYGLYDPPTGVRIIGQATGVEQELTQSDIFTFAEILILNSTLQDLQ